jgi:hypothetical protein
MNPALRDVSVSAAEADACGEREPRRSGPVVVKISLMVMLNHTLDG